MDRRKFLKTATAISASTFAVNSLNSEKVNASSKLSISENRMGVLVDTTLCYGCRKCEWACKVAHNLPAGKMMDYRDRTVLKEMRRPDDKSLMVINKFQNEKSDIIPIHVKFQCMHCDHPACVSACIVGAITKQSDGSVIWDTEKCIGCRYCMVACPFQIPAFEYEKAFDPKIMKCDFCWDRTQTGQLPACVEICPAEAIIYGKRSELLIEAKNRIKRAPNKYIDHIFGEFEVGGTSWLYLASQDFNKLSFPKLGQDPAPGVSESIQHGIFAYFIPPIALYSILGGIMWLTKSKNKNSEIE
jgi:Fe-S-cluster-containing dehydrogenase component